MNVGLATVKDGRGAQNFTSEQVNALVNFAEKEQRGYVYYDEMGVLRLGIPGPTNLSSQ